MENSTLVANTTTHNALNYELCPGWKNVREFSIPLAVFGAVLSTLLPVLSVVGSILLLLVIMKFSQLRHIPSNLLLASLATSDLLIGLLVQPYHSAMSVCALTTSESSFLRFLTDIPSAVSGYFASFLLYSSCLNIAVITVDRYVSIAHSLRYHSIVTESRVIKTVAGIWTITAVLPATRLIPFFPMTGFRVLQFAIIFSVLFSIILSYVKLFRISRRHQRHNFSVTGS